MKKITAMILFLAGMLLIGLNAHASTQQLNWYPPELNNNRPFNTLTPDSSYQVLRDCDVYTNMCTYTIIITAATEDSCTVAASVDQGIVYKDYQTYGPDELLRVKFRYALYENGSPINSHASYLDTWGSYAISQDMGAQSKFCNGEDACAIAPPFSRNSGYGEIYVSKEAPDKCLIIVKIQYLNFTRDKNKKFTLQYERPVVKCIENSTDGNGVQTWCARDPYLDSFVKVTDDNTTGIEIDLSKNIQAVPSPSFIDIVSLSNADLYNFADQTQAITCPENEVISGIKALTGDGLGSFNFGCEGLYEREAIDYPFSTTYFTETISASQKAGSRGYNMSPNDIGPYDGYALIGWKTRTCHYNGGGCATIYIPPVIGSFVPIWKNVSTDTSHNDIISDSYSESFVGQKVMDNFDCNDWVTTKCPDGKVVTSVRSFQGEFGLHAITGTCGDIPSITSATTQLKVFDPNKDHYTITLADVQSRKYKINTTLVTASLNGAQQTELNAKLWVKARYEKKITPFLHFNRGDRVNGNTIPAAGVMLMIGGQGDPNISWSEAITCSRSTTDWTVECEITAPSINKANPLPKFKIEAYMDGEDGGPFDSSPPLTPPAAVQEDLSKARCLSKGSTWVEAAGPDHGCHDPCTNGCLLIAADHYTCKTKPTATPAAGKNWMYLSGVDKCVEAPVCDNGCKNILTDVSAACTVAPSGYTFDAATNKCTRPSAAPCPISGQRRFRGECKCDPDLGKPKLENNVCVACPTGTHWVAGDVNTCESDTPAPPLPPAPPAGDPKTPADPGDTDGNGCGSGQTMNGYDQCVGVAGASVNAPGKGGGCSLVASEKADDNLTYPIILMICGLLIVAVKRRMVVRKG